MPQLQTDTLRLETQPDGSAILWLDVQGRSVNVVTRRMLADLDAAVAHVEIDASLRALILRSAKPCGFLAGADVHELAAVRSVADAEALSGQGQAVLGKLAALRLPTVAVIHGSCLGGGLELALACDYRLVIDVPGTQLGLPEVELGLLPAWGGTQRLPRVVGLERALQMILGGRRLGVRDALHWRLADAVVRRPEEAQAASLELAQRGKRQRAGLPRHTWRQTLLESNPLGRHLVFGGTERLLRRKVPDDMPAPREAFEAVRVGVTEGMEAGLVREREAVGRLVLTPACHNLVTLFLRREEARKLPAGLRDVPTRPVGRVGVVGLGTMGAAVAQLCALRGLGVAAQEVNEEALGAGAMRLQALFQQAVIRRLVAPAEADRLLSAVTASVTWQGFDDVDVVLEAAVEERTAKQVLFRELERRTRPDAVLATNTSSLTVGSLAAGLAHPSRVAGMHFFNPVHKMPLVEVVAAPATGEATVASLARLAVTLGKTPVVVGDSPGFVVNRVLVPYLDEAVRLVAEGMDTAAVDAEMRHFGMPLGPLELLDQVGLDVAAHIAEAVQPVFAGRFPPNPVFALLAEKGWLGQKNGIGFYRHRGRRKRVNELAENTLRAAAELATRDEASAGTSFDQARDRMVLRMVNEASLCLVEGLAGAAEIDLAMVLGTGWAPHRGGPLRYADNRGLREVVQTLAVLAQLVGPRFEPCAELRRRAEKGERFDPQPVVSPAPPAARTSP